MREGVRADNRCRSSACAPFRLLWFLLPSPPRSSHSHNVGNFGSFFTWWDHLCGTDQPFIKWEIKQAKLLAEQQQQQQQQATGGKAVKAE